jgi:hypothetical protein
MIHRLWIVAAFAVPIVLAGGAMISVAGEFGVGRCFSEGQLAAQPSASRVDRGARRAMR